ncbi:MAG: hypothetical protein ACFFER_05670, partial [Candidatus Thorarchaeota archaeon]
EEFAACFYQEFEHSPCLWKNLSLEVRAKNLFELVKRAIDLFRPFDVLDKISADQFLIFATCMLLKRNIVANQYEIEKDLMELPARFDWPFRYSRIASMADRGYIQKH